MTLLQIDPIGSACDRGYIDCSMDRDLPQEATRGHMRQERRKGAMDRCDAVGAICDRGMERVDLHWFIAHACARDRARL